MKNRVHEIGREARVPSIAVIKVARSLGYPVRSASSKLDLQPSERAALIRTVQKHKDEVPHPAAFRIQQKMEKFQ